mmetsp:Transcript_9869/g.16159  ORF Transcript_9869/g.16159 Transcript_9869/m.16159 type:complete len:609 (+) Transcript_9869:229-2055(+)
MICSLKQCRLAILAVFVFVTCNAKKNCNRPSNYFKRSQLTCSELATTFTKIFYPTDKEYCVISDFRETGDSGATCHAGFTWNQAVQKCKDIGMRLCNPDEYAGTPYSLTTACNIKTTSKTRRYHVNMECDDANSAVHATADSLSNPRKDQFCRSKTGTFSGTFLACCADKTKEGELTDDEICGRCPLNSQRKRNWQGKSACECDYGYTGSYGSTTATGENQGLKACVKNVMEGATQCSAGEYSARTEERCDGDTGLIATRGWKKIKGWRTCSAVRKITAEGTCLSRKNNAWADANALCSANGARLCTLKELESGAAHWSRGCGLWRKMIWTGSTCNDSGSKMFAYRPKGNQYACIEKQREKDYGIACCADYGTAPRCLSCGDGGTSSSGSTDAADCSCGGGRNSNNKCKPTKAPTPAPTLGPDCPANSYKLLKSVSKATSKQGRKRGRVRSVYGHGAKSSGSCVTQEVTHEEAEQACEAQGSRLCTKWEVEKGEVWRAGCNSLDDKYTWTSTPCCDTNAGNCEVEKYFAFAMKGTSGHWPNRPRRKCVAPNSDKVHVKCCRDVNTKATCKSCPKYSSSSSGSIGISSCSCDSGYVGRDGGACVVSGGD